MGRMENGKGANNGPLTPGNRQQYGALSDKKRSVPLLERTFWFLKVGVAGFEPTASSSRTTRATGLRYTPKTGRWGGLFSVFYFHYLRPKKASEPGSSKALGERLRSFRRSGRIRTYDLQHPMLARYQATLHPVGIGATKVRRFPALVQARGKQSFRGGLAGKPVAGDQRPAKPPTTGPRFA